MKGIEKKMKVINIYFLKPLTMIITIILSIILTMNNIKIAKVEINEEYQNQMITLEVFGHQWEYFVDKEDIKNF